MSSFKWERMSDKHRTRLLVQATGLEACFTPKVVLETLCNVKGNVYVAATGRDGRILWKGNSKLIRFPDVQRRFWSPWSLASKSEKRKAARFSYLVRVFSEQRLPEQAVKPFVRLALQIWNLKMHDFVMLTRKILSYAKHRIIRSTRIGDFSSNRLIPFRTGKVVKSKDSNLGVVPLWDYRRRKPPWGSTQVP